MTRRDTDVLVIGTGLAGCAAALAAARGGARVLMLTKQARPEESNTWYAQGGIIYEGERDSAERLAADIEAAGAGLCDRAAVDLLSREGPRLVKDLLIDDVGVPFDRGPGGALDLTAEAAHSVPRIVHHADGTGRSIGYTGSFAWFGTLMPFTPATANNKILVAMTCISATGTNVIGGIAVQI